MPFITTWRAHLRKPSFIVHLASIECQILVEEVCDQLSLINVYMYVCVLSCCSHVQLWDPMNCSPTGSSVHGDSPGKNTGVGFHAFLSCVSCIAGRFFIAETLGKPIYMCVYIFVYICINMCICTYNIHVHIIYIIHIYTHINVYIHIHTAIAHKHSTVSLSIIPLDCQFFSLIHFFSTCIEHHCVLDTIILGRDKRLCPCCIFFPAQKGVMGNQAVSRTLSLPFLRLHAGGEGGQMLPWKEAREEQKVTSQAREEGGRGGHRVSLPATVWDQCPSKKVLRTQGEGG